MTGMFIPSIYMGKPQMVENSATKTSQARTLTAIKKWHEISEPCEMKTEATAYRMSRLFKCWLTYVSHLRHVSSRQKLCTLSKKLPSHESTKQMLVLGHNELLDF